MDPQEDIRPIAPISHVRSKVGQMVQYVNERKTPIIITQRGEAKAVLMDMESYQDTEDAFALLNIIKISEIDMENGKARLAEDVFKDLRKKVTAHG